ncbi:phosphatidylethanolamine N-methyltransferase, variant 3 [Plenodomus lindquistii]|nr:phosphatidylethanolamine N-methyltransferase, variant 3 [Plenodomus lindquistii]
MADMGNADGSQVRERPSAKPMHLANSGDARQRVLELNDQEDRKDKNDYEKRTYGRTPDGTVFVVPHTHDMVSQLLSPSQPKNLSDLAVLAVLASLILTFCILPKSARIPIFAAVFLFWRAGYNAGIGWLLDGQSKHRRLVLWAKNSHIFEDPASGKNPHPAIYQLLKREMETKIPDDYKFEQAPLEYNAWLVFRRVVDLILMCDFVSYCLFAIACFNRPQESWLLWALRWTTGVSLFLFNLWVKLDAHRVVGDYAWFWGDHFFLIDQNLTFDGVYELAPHPMYSVGYAGYYGIALMTASYKVLAISIIAHAAQFAFLILVENPHIEKTYNPPAPRRTRHNSGHIASEHRPSTSQSDALVGDISPTYDPVRQPAPMHHIVGNIDFHRLIDVTVVLAYFYTFCLAILTPNTGSIRTMFFINAFVWRLWYTLGLGYILDRQSKKKNWTRHFIKYGDSKEEAWRQWKSLCHLSMTMCHVSFVAAAWKTYTLPPDWAHGLVFFRYVLGSALIALQMWVASSIYDSLGEFGWHFGDFFYDPPSKNLTYSGIYRFLNNPERILGLAGVWGVALITWNAPVFYLASTAHMLNLFFLQFVEGPHMKKLYGQKLRETSGVSKTLRQALPSPVRHWQSAADVYVNAVVEVIERFIDSIKPRFASKVDDLIKTASALFKSSTAHIPISRSSDDFPDLDPKQYRLEISGTLSPPAVEQQKNGGREGELARTPAVRTSEFKTLVLEYGAPIRVRWQAPLNHSKKDWIGLYMVADNQSRKVTRISSNGRWVATCQGVYGSVRAEDGILVSDRLEHADPSDEETSDCYTGEIEFRGDKLWWTTGVFEFRYHHGGKHNVMALSQAFEIRIPRFDEDDVEVDANGTIHRAVETTLLPLVQNCFDRDPDIAPSTAEESFGSLVERDGKFAKRVVFAVHQM